MGSIFNAMIEFFEEDDWEFSWVDDASVLSMGFSGKNGKWMCYAQAREEQQQFVFYTVCPMNTPENKRAALAEFITRANYGMIIGNFEMDWDDGEVRYKTSIDVEGATLSSPLIKQLVYSNVLIMDRYLPGLMAVMFGNAAPRDEINRIEGGYKSAPPVNGLHMVEDEIAVEDTHEFKDEDTDDTYEDNDKTQPRVPEN
ncbi:MAG: YbjN domain-containing protein [Chloroflexi bacterium]|nr:YbjN domain-containing protein [Chloroflexota bacterium]